MAAESPEKLWQLWKQEGLTADQAVGQMLQVILALEARVQQLEQQVRKLEQARGRVA